MILHNIVYLFSHWQNWKSFFRLPWALVKNRLFYKSFPFGFASSTRVTYSYQVFENVLLLRPRTHGVKKVPESHKFDSNLAQNPLFWFKFAGTGHFFDSMCTSPKGWEEKKAKKWANEYWNPMAMNSPKVKKGEEKKKGWAWKCCRCYVDCRSDRGCRVLSRHFVLVHPINFCSFLLVK